MRIVSPGFKILWGVFSVQVQGSLFLVNCEFETPLKR